ncbi:maleylacetate reductase [Alpinimonas psychrophila]|uniref:Maleylacetate reductase n=1 Tax=Alpinimonas psychrophila TaxID=748908 RepID=A0A7W3JTT0_9MICO|nr:maleylacetate reductase [Alpinimonas psychrophila]MBA8829123.1 maleylacetate reductase [Alpinimonas psychrophila]
MGLNFTHETLGQRLLFGSGKAAINVAEEVARQGSRKVMLVATSLESEIVRTVTSRISIALTCDDVVQHVPIEGAEAARKAATDNGIDLIISVGGGSATGLAKAIALTTGIPILAVATTYAGSEATNVWGLTEATRKTTGSDIKVLPVAVVYDAQLTYSLPVDLSIASGMNAIAHCIDSMWAPGADPINQALATEGIRALASGLPMILRNPSGERGRELALYGAYLSAASFASAGSGMHHKICHVLGGTYRLPHAQTHASVLPYVLAFNAPFAEEANQRIAYALGASSGLEGLNLLRAALNVPTGLKDLGFEESNIEEASEIIFPLIPESNPRKVSRENLIELLHTAWAGETPVSNDER